jgi:hypothetical protein
VAAFEKAGDVALDAAAAEAPGNERENGGEDAAEEDQSDAEFDWHGGCYQREGKTEGEEEFHYEWIFLAGELSRTLCRSTRIMLLTGRCSRSAAALIFFFSVAGMLIVRVVFPSRIVARYIMP